MKRSDAAALDRVFSALAHPVRRSIVEQCLSGQRSIAELAEPHKMSLNAISKHVKKLEAAHLVTRNKDGNFHRITLRAKAVQPALNWLTHHADIWERSLMSLKTELEHKK